MSIADLDADLKAVAPIHGVSVGNKEDKATWRIDFKPEATQAEKDAAASVLANFADINKEPPKPAEYRIKRKERYIKELGDDSSVINTLGDVIDAMLTDYIAKNPTVATDQTELGAMVRKIAQIKLEIPKS